MIRMKEKRGCTETGLVQGKDQNKTERKVANSSLQQLLQTVIKHIMTSRNEIEAALEEKVNSCKNCDQQQSSAQATTGMHSRTQKMFLNSIMYRISPTDAHVPGLVHVALCLHQGREESVNRILGKTPAGFIGPVQEVGQEPGFRRPHMKGHLKREQKRAKSHKNCCL